MPSPELTPSQIEKQEKGLKEFHSNPNKATSAGSIKEPRAINNVRRKIADLTDPSADIIRKAIMGGLIADIEVWKGTEKQKLKITSSDHSATFETIEVEKGLFVEVLKRYGEVSKTRIELAKWIISQDIALKKAAEESKLRKLETATKKFKAEKEGAILKDDLQKVAKEFGGPKPLFSMDFQEDDEDDLDE